MAGCVGYQLGPVRRPEYRSVAVPMFKNRTLRPQLEAQLTNAVIKRLQTDGTLAVRSADDADVIVRGEIVDYERATIRGDLLDTTVPRELRLTVRVRVEAYDRVTGAAVLPSTVVSGTADTFVGTDQQSAERQALPLIADDLAKKLVGLLTEAW
ncbi:MAG: LPS assembly lipoprotein LptE [Verrucomicrobiae bacterium]|nr:LPS assembly lipoprotein LptE [Verrucomicrobiae bacterium]